MAADRAGLTTDKWGLVHAKSCTAEGLVLEAPVAVGEVRPASGVLVLKRSFVLTV